jgi:hypothetical protein
MLNNNQQDTNYKLQIKKLIFNWITSEL